MICHNGLRVVAAGGYDPSEPMQARVSKTAGRIMKITVDLDCTPVEARQLMGLPDVQPLQAALLAEIEKKMMADLERFSPEGIARAWLSPLGGEQFSDAIGSWLRQAAPNAPKSSKT
jgi:hypothetical protein